VLRGRNFVEKWLTDGMIPDKMRRLNWNDLQSLSEARCDRRRAPHAGQGHTDSRVECRKPHACAVATSVALLIELKAQVL
jgi:hypothetical protein